MQISSGDYENLVEELAKIGWEYLELREMVEELQERLIEFSPERHVEMMVGLLKTSEYYNRISNI